MKKNNFLKILSEKNIPNAGVYFMTQNNEFVKIGITKNVGERYSSVSSNNPHKVDIIGFMPELNGKKRRKIEQKLHKYFKKYHKKGEWFYLTEEIIDFLEVLSINKY